MKKYNIRATFFVCGNDTEFGRSVYKRIVREGHAIGNHTYSHDYANYASIEKFMKDYYKLEELIYNTTGVRTKIMRFPGGSNNHVSRRYSPRSFMVQLTDEIESRGYEYFDWNVSNGDASGGRVPKATLIRNVKNQLGNKKAAIILMHDSGSKATTVQSLPYIIDYIISKDYKFDVLTEKSYRINFKIN